MSRPPVPGLRGQIIRTAQAFAAARDVHDGWRGVHAYRAGARVQHAVVSVDDAHRALAELVADGLLERRNAPGGFLWRWRPETTGRTS